MKGKEKLLGVLAGVGVSLLLMPATTFAADFSNVVKNNTLEIKGVPPTSEMHAIFAFEQIGEDHPGFVIDTETCNDDYTVCDVVYYGQSSEDNGRMEEVNISYKYDSAVKKVVDGFIPAMKNGSKTFIIKDVDYLSYVINNMSVVTASREFKKLIGYKNFDVDFRAGADGELYQEALGNPMFKYKDDIYYVGDQTKFVIQQLIYVNNDSTNIAKDIENRIKALFPGHEVTVIANPETLSATLTRIENEFSEYFDQESGYLTETYGSKETYVATLMADYEFLDSAEGLYQVTVDEETFVVAAEKTTEALENEVSVVTSDVDSDVTISANKTIPLDTLIQVARITSGDDYDKVVKAIKLNNIVVYDLKLYSKTSGYVTELEDGTFEVKVPMDSSLDPKSVKAYYVDSDGKVTEYDVEVTSDGKYGIFRTNHFSVYTLASPENPKTYDNVLYYVFGLLFSVTGLVIVTIKK